MKIDPFDVAARVLAIPATMWSVTGALLASRRWDGIVRQTASPGLTARMRDGFFGVVEDQFASRWIPDVRFAPAATRAAPTDDDTDQQDATSAA